MTPDPDRELIPLERAELTARLRWFIQLRWVFGIGLLVTGLILVYAPLAEVHGGLIAGVGAGILLYNCVFWRLERRLGKVSLCVLARRAPLAAAAQIILDMVALTVVLHAAGGVENPFFIFYLFHMVIATLLLPARNVYVLALLAILLFGALAFSELNRWLPHSDLFGVERHYQAPRFAVVTLLAFASAVLIAVYLGTSIAQTLRAREHEVLRLEQELEARARELEATNQALRKADEEKTQFFRKISHDLKTPLAAQQSLLRSVLIELNDIGPGPRHRIERAIARGDELLALFNDLLILSRSRDVTRPLRYEWVDPVDRLQGMLEAQAVHAEERGVDWHVELGEPVPSICAEPGLLPALAENIVSNAIKYTPAGGSVTFSLRGCNDYLVLQTRDTGIGIAKEDVDRIGQEFFRTRAARESGASGTGLGMAIVRAMVEKMQGRLDIRSESGKGTTVTIWLPVARPEVLGDAPAEPGESTGPRV